MVLGPLVSPPRSPVIKFIMVKRCDCALEKGQGGTLKAEPQSSQGDWLTSKPRFVDWTNDSPIYF